MDPGLAGCVHQIRPARRAHHLARPQRLLNQIIGATRAARRAGGAAASAARSAATNRRSTEPAYSYCTLLDLCVYADHCAGSRGQREVCQYRTCITVYSKYCVPVNVNGSCERALVRAHAGFTLCPGQKPPAWAIKRPVRPHRSAMQTRFTMETLRARNRPGPARTVGSSSRAGSSEQCFW